MRASESKLRVIAMFVLAFAVIGTVIDLCALAFMDFPWERRPRPAWSVVLDLCISAWLVVFCWKALREGE